MSLSGSAGTKNKNLDFSRVAVEEQFFPVAPRWPLEKKKDLRFTRRSLIFLAPRDGIEPPT
jgi:hypothetical protein